MLKYLLTRTTKGRAVGHNRKNNFMAKRGRPFLNPLHEPSMIDENFKVIFDYVKQGFSIKKALKKRGIDDKYFYKYASSTQLKELEYLRGERGALNRTRCYFKPSCFGG
jgi:hypothetical protein